MRTIVAETGIEAWASHAWRESATSWVDEQLERHAIRRTGELEQQTLQPWATVLSARTTHGRVWLKATGPGTSFEPALYELLGRAIPERVLAPIATDETRGWLLLPDGGPPLADRLAGAELAEALATILRCYAELQRAFAPHLDAALDAGVADMRPEIMPARFEEAVETVGRHHAATMRQSAKSRRFATATARGASAWRPRQGRRASTTTTCTPGTCSSQRSTGLTRCDSTTGETP